MCLLAQLETARALVSGQQLQQVYLFLASMFSSPGADHVGILQRLEVSQVDRCIPLGLAGTGFSI
jgi:hypothetical protein